MSQISTGPVKRMMDFLQMSTFFHTYLVAERRRVDEEFLQAKGNMEELLESRGRKKDSTQTRRATL
jgi:hypothetical protein